MVFRMKEINDLVNKYGNIGNGYEKAKCLLIVPKPICDKDMPAAYGYNTPEANMLKGIFTKLEIDPQDWWITTAADETGVVSLPRLCDILYEISPKLVILAGIDSCNAFFGNDDLKSYGPIECENYQVYFTIDFSQYLNAKQTNPDHPGTIECAKELFKQWQEIKMIYNQLAD